MPAREKAPRAWQRMLSGRRLDLLDPSPLDVEISDIAQGLARVARWNGQTRGDHAFSVAQHSLMVEAIVGRISPASPQTLLLALLHDAPEYVIGDMISPFKAVVGGGYKTVEAKLEAARGPQGDQGSDQAGGPDRRLFRGDRTGGISAQRSTGLLRAAPRHKPRHGRCVATLRGRGRKDVSRAL